MMIKPTTRQKNKCSLRDSLTTLNKKRRPKNLLIIEHPPSYINLFLSLKMFLQKSRLFSKPIRPRIILAVVEILSKVVIGSLHLQPTALSAEINKIINLHKIQRELRRRILLFSQDLLRKSSSFSK